MLPPPNNERFYGELRVESAFDLARCRAGVLSVDTVRAVYFDAVEVVASRLTIGLPATAIRTLGLDGRWSEWRGVRVFDPVTLSVFDRFVTLDVTEVPGRSVWVGRLLLEHLQLVVDSATRRLGKSPANDGECVLDMF